jgi:hypothetical protein
VYDHFVTTKKRYIPTTRGGSISDKERKQLLSAINTFGVDTCKLVNEWICSDWANKDTMRPYLQIETVYKTQGGTGHSFSTRVKMMQDSGFKASTERSSYGDEQSFD